jgi:hypothetical protein
VRVKKLKLPDNRSLEWWLLAGWLAFLVFGLIPWMLRHSR